MRDISAQTIKKGSRALYKGEPLSSVDLENCILFCK